jgi:hypothetical protein
MPSDNTKTKEAGLSAILEGLCSEDAREKLRLPILEEALRQMKKESHASIKSKNAQTHPCGTAPGF